MLSYQRVYFALVLLRLALRHWKHMEKYMDTSESSHWEALEKLEPEKLSPKILDTCNYLAQTRTHTHTHTRIHTYIYIYIYYNSLYIYIYYNSLYIYIYYNSLYIYKSYHIHMYSKVPRCSETQRSSQPPLRTREGTSKASSCHWCTKWSSSPWLNLLVVACSPFIGKLWDRFGPVDHRHAGHGESGAIP